MLLLNYAIFLTHPIFNIYVYKSLDACDAADAIYIQRRMSILCTYFE